MTDFDAVVVGSGPNGLSAAATLARTGRRVLVVERADTIGGGLRTEEITLPGFRHDVCSAFHPLGMGSPFMRMLPLAEHGLEWIQPELPVAHPIAPGRSVLLHRDIAETAAGLGMDGAAYHRRLSRMTESWPLIEDHVMGPLVRIPKHPVALARFGVFAAAPAMQSAERLFETEEARALFAGCAAHAFLPLTHPLTGSFGWLLLVTAHRFGWPIAAGGSGSIADAMASYLRSLGTVIETGTDVTDLARAGTVHIGGTAAQIDAAETDAWHGRGPASPFVLVGQQSLFDPTRAPEGRHTVWAYAHVPNGSTADYTDVITRRIEEFAPGFADTILDRAVFSPADLERRNPNNVGGDISGGAHTLTQLAFRPFPSIDPYTTPLDGVYLGSSSTPPGGGTHGMSGHHAAMTALERA